MDERLKELQKEQSIQEQFLKAYLSQPQQDNKYQQQYQNQEVVQLPPRTFNI